MYLVPDLKVNTKLRKKLHFKAQSYITRAHFKKIGKIQLI